MAGSITSTTIEHRSRGVIKMKAVITCDASGDASVSVIGVAFGKLVGVGYVPGTLATGVDITVSDTASGKALLTLTNAGLTARYFRPTAVVSDSVGTAVAAATTAPNVNRDIFVGGKISLLVAQGGNLGAGELHLVIDESDIGHKGVGQGS
jgi:hypothetical protein